MSNYVISVRFPSTYQPSADSAEPWKLWFGELGSALVERGNPIFARQTLGDCGPDSLLGGYTLISADNLDAAVAAARSCPILGAGGGVEVGEITEVM